MAKVSVGFRHPGKPHYYGSGDLEVKRGTRVFVETARGLETGVMES